MRFDAAKSFFEKVSAALSENFRLTTCGINSASASANSMGSDARIFTSGCNYVNLEMSGNTPPYKHDPVTVNTPIAARLVGSSHHLAVAREKGINCFSTGFAFTEETANIVWAVNKMLGSDCWLSTLKDRLGLPDHILNTLPDEWDIVGKAFGFEREHEELFCGKQIAQLGVYFSYETRKHTFFGGVDKGYYLDLSSTLKLLFNKGLSPHTIFKFPQSTKEYPVVLVPSPAKMTEDEKNDLNNYLTCGGKVIVFGPADVDGCESKRQLPTSPAIDKPEAFFGSVPNGVWFKAPSWRTSTEFPPLSQDSVWKEVKEGLFYNPARMTEGNVADSLIDLVKQYTRPMPVDIISAEGYLMTFFESDDHYTVQMLAEDFDTDIDHKLDEMRFHRSRVNFVNYVEPVGVTQEIALRSSLPVKVFTPFNKEATLSQKNEVCKITLPEKTSFLILQFVKN